jgi:hypothetical protein
MWKTKEKFYVKKFKHARNKNWPINFHISLFYPPSTKILP